MEGAAQTRLVPGRSPPALRVPRTGAPVDRRTHVPRLAKKNRARPGPCFWDAAVRLRGANGAPYGVVVVCGALNSAATFTLGLMLADTPLRVGRAWRSHAGGAASSAGAAAS